jgi:hypothetical protein
MKKYFLFLLTLSVYNLNAQSLQELQNKVNNISKENKVIVAITIVNAIILWKLLKRKNSNDDVLNSSFNNEEHKEVFLELCNLVNNLSLDLPPLDEDLKEELNQEAALLDNANQASAMSNSDDQANLNDDDDDVDEIRQIAGISGVSVV